MHDVMHVVCVLLQLDPFYLRVGEKIMMVFVIPSGTLALPRLLIATTSLRRLCSSMPAWSAGMLASRMSRPSDSTIEWTPTFSPKHSSTCFQGFKEGEVEGRVNYPPH